MNRAQRERAAETQARARRVNERVDRVSQVGRIEGELMALACECPHMCDATLEIPHRDYEATRADPSLFLVVHGHELTETDEVVARERGYVVVRKTEGRADGVPNP